MLAQALPAWVVGVVSIGLVAAFLLAVFAVAYAKRDVTIDITLFEYHR